MDALPRRWSPIARRFAPFAAVGLLALLTAVLPPAPGDWMYVGVAAGLTIALAVLGVLTPWERMPRWTYLLPALAYLVVVALLREAHGGGASGYAVLAILPVVWVAITLGRREMTVTIVGVATLLLVPLLAVGGDRYPTTEWRRAVVTTLVATIVGFSVQDLVAKRREQAHRAERRADELAASESTIAAVARIARTDWSRGDARAVICDAAFEVTAARLVTIVEPAATGRLEITASTGPAFPATELEQDVGLSGSVIAFRSGHRHVVLDAQNDPAVPREIAAATGIECVQYEPILRDGSPIGVLTVSWATPLERVPPSTRTAVELLATEAGRAIERADLLLRLQQLADTDELTGLPNRRSWELRLPELTTTAHMAGQPLCVAIVDLDRFKTFNDRNGHQSGDNLLRRAATAWQGCLRQGDLLARYGGEEFALALPHCRLDEAASVIERLRGVTPFGQTCSAGVAELLSDESPDALVARADHALYDAKRHGRDRLVVAAAA